jgi:hypothetical protein
LSGAQQHYHSCSRSWETLPSPSGSTWQVKLHFFR